MMPPAERTGGEAEVGLEEAVDLLRSAARVLLVTHRNPDGDSIGSATALGAALRARGGSVQLVCPDPLPRSLLSIPDAELVGTAFASDECDLLVSVDVSDPRLLYPLAAADAAYFAARPSLNIDHHVSNLRFARHNLVDPGAASAAEIVLQLVERLQVPVDRRLATQLLYGFVNDTHSFQNSNTTPRTLRMAAQLVEAGADLPGVTYDLLLARSPTAARLWAQVLPTLRFEDDGRVASLVVSLAALDAAGASTADADGLVEFVRSIRGVDLAVVYKQIDPATYRLSLRTTERVDATLVAGRFGGGGHRRAAGCDATGALPEVQQRILDAYERARLTGDG